MQNVSYENEFDFHESEPVGRKHFHMNGSALRLVLIQRQKPTRKWPFNSNLLICTQIYMKPFITVFSCTERTVGAVKERKHLKIIS